MRCNEFSVFNYFASPARVIHLVTLSIVPGVSRICRKPCSILSRSISAFSIDVAYAIDFKDLDSNPENEQAVQQDLHDQSIYLQSVDLKIA